MNVSVEEGVAMGNAVAATFPQSHREKRSIGNQRIEPETLDAAIACLRRDLS